MRVFVSQIHTLNGSDRPMHMSSDGFDHEHGFSEPKNGTIDTERLRSEQSLVEAAAGLIRKSIVKSACSGKRPFKPFRKAPLGVAIRRLASVLVGAT